MADRDEIKVRMGFIKPTEKAADFVVIAEAWECPCGGFSFGPLRSTMPGTSALVECPSCGTTAEVVAE